VVLSPAGLAVWISLLVAVFPGLLYILAFGVLALSS